ncbi:MAG TPA: ABC transporter permease [Candidatus Limnocylindria bacterium]|nr:ABC transporter permease [Candidatus Limnocylindria bacterium]
MRTRDLLSLALGNVGRARVRSILTILGVAIGTALVVLLIALASGAEENVKRSIFSIGDLRLVTVQPFQPGASGLTAVPRTITDDHVAKLRLIPHVSGAYRQFDAPLGTLLEGGEDAAVRPQGIEPNAPLDRGDLVAGRHIEAGERLVAVLPANLARLVAPTAEAAVGRQVTLRLGGAVKIGQTRIAGSGTPREYKMTVVGVFDERNTSQTSVRIPLEDAIAAAAENRGLPADELRRTTGYSGVSLETEDSKYVGDVVSAVQQLGFSAFSLKQVIEQIDQGFGVFRGILAGIGGVALLVAAIGIANTMIMAVLERTREIGIMKAVGAAPRDIRALFLAEAALVGIFGGVLGLALGLAGGKAIEEVIRQLNPRTNPPGIFVVDLPLALGSLGLALAVSLIAGFLPSRRAMRMSALSALRYE